MEDEVIILTKSGCPNCVLLKRLLDKLKVTYTETDYLEYEEQIKRQGFYSLPILLINNHMSQPRSLEELKATLEREGILD